MWPSPVWEHLLYLDRLPLHSFSRGWFLLFRFRGTQAMRFIYVVIAAQWGVVDFSTLSSSTY